MSHAATNWAIKQRGLKPATKIVLWHLADCHNAHTGQCNPRQAILADLCEMSRSTLNVHLAELERRGLIRRHQSVDEATRKQRPTHYTLAMDGPIEPPQTDPENGTGSPVKSMSGIRTRQQDIGGQTQDVVDTCPESGHGNHEKPCPDFSQFRVRNPDTKNLGIEPGIDGGGGSACAREAENDPAMKAADEPTFREQVLTAMGHDPSGVTASGRIIGGSSDMLELDRWRTDLGLSDVEILGVIREVCLGKREDPPSTFRYFRKAMQRFAGEKAEAPLQKITPTTNATTNAGGSNDKNRTDKPSRAELRMRAFIAGARGTA